ncbi:hypothetical protein [Paraconexibacter algicola]|uniref:Uncharacterized protein n=1 Tax=Paraconexibacter algicola TaxID=2133960 RepID=A0A2T4UK95_9ACTN|nr:hypothetical protein [Paraconexibacter algicola]PTL59650.1 hypothetical protein C7Y72_08305 [Paraconexibacter algicola]
MSPRSTAALAALTAVLATPALALAGAGDRDHDRMPDRWERSHQLSTRSDDSARDTDRDGLSNRGEYLSGTDPRDRDSDDDGVRDAREDRDRDGVSNAREMRDGTSPCDRDSDDDGVRDDRDHGDDDRGGDGTQDRGDDDRSDDDRDRSDD